MNTVTAPGIGALAGFALMLRAPVPVACGWAAVETTHRQHQPADGMAPAHAQLRAQLRESPDVLAARLDAVTACMTMADVATDDPAADRLTVIQTTGDGWAVLALGRARIASVVVEMSGVSAPVAIAILTRQYAHRRRAASRTASPGRPRRKGPQSRARRGTAVAPRARSRYAVADRAGIASVPVRAFLRARAKLGGRHARCAPTPGAPS